MTCHQTSESRESSGFRIGFIMSTELGLRTHYLNWRNGLTPDLGVRPEWIVVDWWKHYGLVECLPLVPDTIKARLRAEIQLRTGLRNGPFDALFVGQERMFHGTNALLFKQHYFISSDVTAKQLAAFGPLYNKEPNGPAFYERIKHWERRERFRRARGLFPWSRWVAESMVEDYGADPSTIHVTPPGVDLAKWDVIRKGTRGEMSGPINILFVGGDFARKGGDLLLDWASKTTRKDWRLNIVTREMVVPPHKNIHVYNRLQPNDAGLLELYAKADIFVLPTWGDCYSIASIEAMAASLPVILSRTGGTEDIITDGKTGYLIDPGDASALAERLDHLIDRPDMRVSLGCAAREDAERRFDARANIGRTISFVKECLRE
jgi:glycosyltransferase involved in cell wall biosynthesis